MNLDNRQALSCRPGRVGLPALEQPAHRTQYVPGRRLRQFRNEALAAPPLFGLEDVGVGERLLALAVSRHAGDCPNIAREAAPCVAVAVPGEDRPRGVLLSGAPVGLGVKFIEGAR